MYQFNKNLFKAAMGIKGITLGQLADLLNISRTTLWRKVRGDGDFTRNEICSLYRIFGDSLAKGFLFCSQVAEKQFKEDL